MYFVVGYALNLSTQRKILWEEIRQFMKNVDIPWLVMGDFNNVRLRQEKVGCRQVPVENLSDFNSLINEADLFEIPMVGGEVFTWHNE